ncbi:methyltransferase, TIGR04325 family [Sphingobacterium siyangense]|uniref:methyltransferase, TIGR04325 family n=1 Tax=Sphingobacterium TaxID=28453 RepID=UPI000957EE11|nr:MULTISPECIES: methyltransferase, TIGR04325 family [Sphingobacterium]APU99198.1 methyltransferase, TIGR04325 family [Sphingobacterium sp. B29]UQA74869.1 methyltransferase, TIGR04325 family [Sphingobacterium siyangense]
MIKKFFSKKSNKERTDHGYGWSGRYMYWEDVKSLTDGYDANLILNRTYQSMLKIRDGHAVYERDSVLFEKKEFPFALISSLLYIATKNDLKLKVIDFGGSLGTTYYQTRDFLKPLESLEWHIVEQESYVELGKKEFENKQLKFYKTIEESIADGLPDIIILSSVVQYLEKPHEFLSYLTGLRIAYLFFDRTAFVYEGPDRLTLQRVPPSIYDASYPAWFFNEAKFLNHFNEYELQAQFASYVIGEQDMLIDGKLAGYDSGFFFKKMI